MTTKQEWEEMGFEVISAYSDEQAVEDGFLHPLASCTNNRVTQALTVWLEEHIPDGAIDCWPVPLGYFTAEGTLAKALCLADGVATVHEHAARRIYDENIGGGIWFAWAVLGTDDKLARLFEGECPTGATKLREDDGPTRARRLWLIPNELGGVTLMFPEDY